MIAITVSTNYDDLLDIIIPQNYIFFEKWYIITDKNDTNTIDVIKKHNHNNICTLFYDFYKNNRKFDKGGAIRYCQNDIINNYNGIVVILDSDIYLPNNFVDIINNTDIKDNTIYGTNKRYDYYSYENFKNKKIDFDYPWSKQFQGYFQLYKNDKHKLYNHSHNCADCDLEFLKYFSKKITLHELDVSHLGKSCTNWDGRINKNDFRYTV